MYLIIQQKYNIYNIIFLLYNLIVSRDLARNSSNIIKNVQM